MKKIWAMLLSIILALGISLSLIGCDNKQFEYVYAPKELYAIVMDSLGNEYKIDISREEGETEKTIEYDLEYFACFDDIFVHIGLKGLYEKDGTPLSTELYQPAFNDTQTVHLSFVGTKVITKTCYIHYLVKGDRGNGSVQSDCELTFHFNVTVKANKLLHKYVTIPDVEIPYEYFDCEMQTIGADDYNLQDFQEYYNADGYEYGYSSKQFSPDGKVLNYFSNIIQRQKQGDTVYQTEKSHSFDPNAEYSWETYQYRQLKGFAPNDYMTAYQLNETDGVFTAGKHLQGGHYVWLDLPPQLEVVKKGTDLIYQAAEKDGCLYLSISGTLTNNEYWDTILVKATYKIQGNKIVACLYEETTTSPYEDNYWSAATYWIPLVGEIELLDETVLQELCELY